MRDARATSMRAATAPRGPDSDMHTIASTSYSTVVDVKAEMGSAGFLRRQSSRGSIFNGIGRLPSPNRVQRERPSSASLPVTPQRPSAASWLQRPGSASAQYHLRHVRRRENLTEILPSPRSLLAPGSPTFRCDCSSPNGSEPSRSCSPSVVSKDSKDLSMRGSRSFGARPTLDVSA